MMVSFYLKAVTDQHRAIDMVACRTGLRGTGVKRSRPLAAVRGGECGSERAAAGCVVGGQRRGRKLDMMWDGA
ncbi:hypothetical protein RLDS_19560 [Sphingobium lactosutens DS20]|uniref:Uncharacterized protein n=1 Tax=Sphingobium lactosutens DS20 TaxID=1331060 RepID=T0H7T0_9SPHN|nr:hypothetical protein RLDS_19560 [Sphingobium lactosutens DS20]